MKKSFDQTFMLTTSMASKYLPEARIPQSALTPVRSDECGLFA